MSMTEKEIQELYSHWDNNPDIFKNEVLKPCPFCGSKRLYISERNYFGEQTATVTCLGCHISQTGNEYGTMEEAIEAWNVRTSDF